MTMLVYFVSQYNTNHLPWGGYGLNSPTEKLLLPIHRSIKDESGWYNYLMCYFPGDDPWRRF